MNNPLPSDHISAEMLQRAIMKAYAQGAQAPDKGYHFT